MLPLGGGIQFRRRDERGDICRPEVRFNHVDQALALLILATDTPYSPFLAISDGHPEGRCREVLPGVVFGAGRVAFPTSSKSSSALHPHQEAK